MRSHRRCTAGGNTTRHGRSGCATRKQQENKAVRALLKRERMSDANVKTLHQSVNELPPRNEAADMPSIQRTKLAPWMAAPSARKDDAFSCAPTRRLPPERTVPGKARQMFARIDGVQIVPDRELGPSKRAPEPEVPVVVPMRSWWGHARLLAGVGIAVGFLVGFALRLGLSAR